MASIAASGAGCSSARRQRAGDRCPRRPGNRHDRAEHVSGVEPRDPPDDATTDGEGHWARDRVDRTGNPTRGGARLSNRSRRDHDEPRPARRKRNDPPKRAVTGSLLELPGSASRESDACDSGSEQRARRGFGDRCGCGKRNTAAIACFAPPCEPPILLNWRSKQAMSQSSIEHQFNNLQVVTSPRHLNLVRATDRQLRSRRSVTTWFADVGRDNDETETTRSQQRQRERNRRAAAAEAVRGIGPRSIAAQRASVVSRPRLKTDSNDRRSDAMAYVTARRTPPNLLCRRAGRDRCSGRGRSHDSCPACVRRCKGATRRGARSPHRRDR